jgi:hypothetical protein
MLVPRSSKDYGENLDFLPMKTCRKRDFSIAIAAWESLAAED